MGNHNITKEGNPELQETGTSVAGMMAVQLLG